MYKLIYDPFSCKVSSVQNIITGMFMPVGSTDDYYQDFLKWNSEQETPLDLNSTVEVIKPPPPRDILKELDTVKADIVKLKAGKVDK